MELNGTVIDDLTNVVRNRTVYPKFGQNLLYTIKKYQIFVCELRDSSFNGDSIFLNALRDRLGKNAI